MMVAEDGTVLEETSYYPFGFVQRGISYTNPAPSLHNKYLYNSKELQQDLGLDQYDYGARFYDAQIARWHTLDPMADSSLNYSVYNYAYSNPIEFTDPDGMLPIEVKPNISNIILNEYVVYIQNDEIIKTVMVGTKGGNVTDFVRVVDLDYISETGQTNVVELKVEKFFVSGLDNYSEESQKNNPTPGYRTYHSKSTELWALETLISAFTGGGGKTVTALGTAKKYTISQVKKALLETYKKLEVDGPMQKMKKGKWGSPQRGDKRKGYRLDNEGHPNSTNPNETGPRINWWDYSKGKYNDGRGPGRKDAVPIR